MERLNRKIWSHSLCNLNITIVTKIIQDLLCNNVNGNFNSPRKLPQTKTMKRSKTYSLFGPIFFVDLLILNYSWVILSSCGWTQMFTLIRHEVGHANFYPKIRHAKTLTFYDFASLWQICFICSVSRFWNLHWNKKGQLFRPNYFNFLISWLFQIKIEC